MHTKKASAVTEAQAVRKRSCQMVTAKDFGTWELVGRHLVNKRQDWHAISLDFSSSAELLDAVFHYSAKPISDQEIADLIRALDRIVRPRQNHCPWGQDRRPSPNTPLDTYLAGGRL